ncbi:pyridine nucleotide-disulfide oxidoreductase [Gordonia oryzae]|uniref:Pyridine nucleotide-disulfide oxidoreductase n=1 Tax=Gordonia oryzae TaxID=2487349 RepID=A0A3N4H2K7_9ACTN|nr:FAD-dependent oxidoreductase [Gordonia oryzae]RPA59394.1 pyridine nucleotide-disulfide oxidoreductase [Gordonia oryzae]
MDSVVIVGAGHAGVEASDALRRNGYDGDVMLVDRAGHLPYQRPPLSKDYLTSAASPSPLPLRPSTFYDDNGIDLRLGVDGIDRGRRAVRLADGAVVPFDHLVLAIGAQPRRLSCPGADLDGVHHLHTVDDAAHLHATLTEASRVVVVGAGFIGLEFASAAVDRGVAVTVLDVADRPMARVLSASSSQLFADLHESRCVQLCFSTGVQRIDGSGGHVTAVVDDSGTRHPADLVVVGIGAVPDTHLARDAGLTVDNGVVDEYLRTSDPHIVAVGDAASFPGHHTAGRVRLEAVQNATDQARCVAATICGAPLPYSAVPWFWTVQCGRKLQIAGLPGPAEEMVRLGDPPAGKGSILGFVDNSLAWVESVGAPADHQAARTLLAHRPAPLTPERTSEPGFSLKTHAKAVRAQLDASQSLIVL